MAICLFTTKFDHRSGNVVQTVKIADFIQQFVKSTESEELKNEAVIIVVKDDENKEIVGRFVKDINANIQVKKISELKEENHKISCCIECCYSHFDWKKELSFTRTKPPIIVMPKYNNGVNRESPLTILGGFDKDCGYVGVIPSPVLLAATAGKEISAEVLQNAFERLDPKIQSYLGKDVKSYLAQRDFTYQYSHDIDKYPTFYNNSIPYKHSPLDRGVSYGKEYAPVGFFLQKHVMLMGSSAKSQDVLCIGEKSEHKLQALTNLKEDLIQKGYTRISFIDIDSKDEKVIYEGDNDGAEHKEYRVLYSKSMPFSSMQVLPLIATDIVGVTGDQSLVEAMSAKKLVTYECVSDIASRYLKSVQREVSEMVLEGTSGEEVQLLARFLIKPTYRCNHVEYKKEEVSRLLSNRNTVEALKNINRQLVEKSQYFESIQRMLMSAVLPYIKKELKLVELLKALCTEVINNRTKSDRSDKRCHAVTQLLQLTKGNVISQEDTSSITAQLEIIKQNEPSWKERSLITKILDILSLGIITIIKCLFFTSDKTMAYVGEIEELNILSP